jgi:hypothetical protein
MVTPSSERKTEGVSVNLTDAASQHAGEQTSTAKRAKGRDEADTIGHAFRNRPVV